jgi:hypothetical protein
MSEIHSMSAHAHVDAFLGEPHWAHPLNFLLTVPTLYQW